MNDKERIESVIQLYIDSINDSDPAKVKQASYGSAKVVGYLHDDFMYWPSTTLQVLWILNNRHQKQRANLWSSKSSHVRQKARQRWQKSEINT